MRETELWTPPEAELWLPAGADYLFSEMTATIRLPHEHEQAAYDLVTERDREAHRSGWPTTPNYRYLHVKPLLGYDLWGFLFDLEQLHRQRRDPSLTKAELAGLTGWGWTKIKDTLRRLRDRRPDPERAFQLLKLYVPGLRPAPHWHGAGSPAWQFILLDGEVLVTDELRRQFARTAAAFSRQRTLLLDLPQGVEKRPLIDPSDPQGVEKRPLTRGRKTTP